MTSSSTRNRTYAGLAVLAAIGILRVSAQPSLPTLPPTSVLQSVPEVADYGVVYELNLPDRARYNYGEPVNYSQNHADLVPDGSFSRVAYALELNTTTDPARAKWVWVSFDRPTNIVSATKLGVPTRPTGVTYHYPNGTPGDTAIAKMNVFSNVAGVVTGTALSTGNIEFWSTNYGTTNAYGVPNANGGTWDFGDQSTPGDYTSMQIGNYGARQTIFAINNWGNAYNAYDRTWNAVNGYLDVGIGNQPGGNPDWTFAQNANLYVVKRLYVLVKMPAPVITSATSVTADYGTPFSYTITATNSPTSFAASPLLPGLSFNTSTGVISGTLPHTVGTYTIGLSATNGYGTGTSVLILTISDSVPPVISAPPTVTAEATSPAGAVVTFSATATDVISGAVPVTALPASGSTFGVGLSSVSLSATDAAGNTATKGILVNVTDTTAPVLTLPANLTAEATGPGGAVVNFAASASDLVNGSVPVTLTPAPGTTFVLGTTTVSASAKDATGNLATGSFNVTVQDTKPPVLTLPASQTIEATSGAGAIANFAATATDIVGVASLRYSTASGSVFALGTTTVSVTATDTSNNVSSGNFTITVVDTTPPVITAPANIVAEATSATGAAVTFSATATDAVSGNVTVTADHASGSTFSIGTTAVTLTATDKAGNTATAVFSVTVRDTTPPVIATQADIVAEATSAAGAVVTFTLKATDNVSTPVVTALPASGSTFALGTTTVTITAQDAAGNTSTSSFRVTVQDTTRPVLTVPANLTLEASSAAGAVAHFSAGATDNVGVTSLSYSANPGSTFAVGDTAVTVTAKDAAGNTATGTFMINVRDTTAPVITSVTPSVTSIWPPNKKMVAVTLTAPVSDAVGVTSLKIISVATNESNADTQWQITGPLTLNLLADRLGNGTGRIYTITVEARDAAGNASTATTMVTVPHDRGK